MQPPQSYSVGGHRSSGQLYRPVMQPPQSYSVGGHRSSGQLYSDGWAVTSDQKAAEQRKDPGKPSSCCKMTRRTKIRTPITAYAIQKEALPCVHAVIFTSNGLKYCSNPTMPWVKKAIEQLQFYTDEVGPFCADPRARWVRSKVNELRHGNMDRNALAELLQALESRRDAEERRREERYTALIERVGLAVAAATTPTTTPLMSPPKARAMKMSAEDDPEAYLVAFERLATAAAWPREFWASQLGPCLIGEAQAAYQAMSDQHATEYDLVKQAILRRLNITAETHRARFREYRRAPETRPRVVAERLCDHMVHWLTPGKKTPQQMGEAIVVEQFCHVVGAETQAWIRRHNPDTLEEAVKLAEDFEDSLTSARIGILSAPALRSSRPLSPSPPSSSPPSFQGSRPG
ncbi:UNVERIFIED_CONTAM: hypothetical protein FKN15_002996 [Acipenser sinensis]